MKRILALLLVLIMLLPACLVRPVEAAGMEEDPIYLVNWSRDDGLEYVYEMPFFWVNTAKLNTPLECVRWSPAGDHYDISQIALALKNKFDTYPDGARYINFCLVQTAFHYTRENVIYVDSAVEICQTWLEAFLSEYKAIGGKLDGLVCDLELEDMGYYYMHDRHYVNDSGIYQRIYEDPRFDTDIRPLLDERGFKYYSNVTEATSALHSLHPKSGDEYAQSRSIWDNVLRSYMNGKITEACAPLWKYYPDAEMNDYQSTDMKPWMKQLSEHGGVISTVGGNLFTSGTVSTTNFYFNKLAAFFRANNQPVYYTIPSYNSAYLENKPFSYFMVDVNIARNIYMASDNKKVAWWIADYIHTEDNKNGVSLTPYYCETLLHLGMLNPQCFNGFIVLNYGNLFDSEVYNDCLTITSQCLKELNRMVGFADREPIAVKPEWNDHYMLSGMRVGDKNVWRLTPDTSRVSVEDFLVEDTGSPKFYVEGQTVTFPQGTIVADSNIIGMDRDYNLTDGNTCGYWIETPAGVEPVITRADNYHSEYPAYMVDYEDYEAGVDYGFKNAVPVACWEVKKTGSASSATIQVNPADAKDNVLAMKGTYTLKNVNLPQNITAGDSYAEHQAWEISVTLPADMPSDGEAVLLKAAGEKKKSKDGGFKISGGNVYYSDANGEYIKLNGVTLEAGKEYTLKRELDFTVADAPTCSYYVYDTNGKLIGGARKVAMASFDLPVTNISLSVSKVTGDAVLLDDYKLYPTKTATDLALYKAELGMPVEDMDKAVGEDVGYRLAWMNATNEAKSYSLMAAYYNGDTLISEKVIKEIQMAPNTEGVETGIAELGNNGSGLRVFVRDNNAPEKEEPAGDINGSSTDTGNGNGAGNGDSNGSGDGSGNTDTTNPTGDNTGIGDSTGNGDETTPTLGTDGTTPTVSTDPTEPGTQGNDGEKGISGGVIALIVILVIAVLGGGFALFWFVIKPKLAEKAVAADAKETVDAEETADTEEAADAGEATDAE